MVADALPVTAEQRRTLASWIAAGNSPQKIVFRASIVLLASDGLANRKIAETWTRNYFTAISGMTNTGSAEVESEAQHDDGLDAGDNSFDVDET